ncbi:serine hydrolase domain-containing protein [Formosa sp. A9]|uniref:serine hydrolase domain-containing protein n=1 Tax=Formosa sp. A9 TaxID=3442641 RepID=UPI003EB90DE0
MKNVLFLIGTLISIFSYSQKTVAEFDAVLAQWDKPNEPGGVVGVVQNGEFIYQKAFGLASLEFNVPNKISTKFQLASIAKQFTAACIILLAQEGKLQLDNTIDQYFPNGPDYYKDITIQHLLNHTSGIWSFEQAFDLLLKDIIITDYEIEKLLNSLYITNFPPGDQWSYCNSGYWLLGKIVEKISDNSLENHLKEHLFTPLKMYDTQLVKDPEIIIYNAANGYSKDINNSYKQRIEIARDIVSSRAIISTLEDLKKWENEFYQMTILNADFWKQMTKPGVLNNGEILEYASGLNSPVYKGFKLIGHSGVSLGFRTSFHTLPEKKLSVIVLLNNGNIFEYDVSSAFFDLFIQDKDTTSITPNYETTVNVPIEMPLNKLQQFSGNFALEESTQFNFSIINNQLTGISGENNVPFQLVPISDSVFVHATTPKDFYVLSLKTFTFSEFKNKQPSKLDIHVKNEYVDLVEHLNRQADFHLNLDSYVGIYRNETLNVSYEFIKKNENLFLKVKNYEPIKINFKTPYKTYNIPHIAWGGFTITFLKKTNEITSLILSSDRVQNLELKKIKT